MNAIHFEMVCQHFAMVFFAEARKKLGYPRAALK